MMIEMISSEFYLDLFSMTYLCNLVVFLKSPMQCHDDNDRQRTTDESQHG